MKRRYKIADTETAGFRGPDEKGSGVVEIAWIEIDEELNELDRRVSLINPGRPIEEGAQGAHGISDADVAFAPALERWYPNNWDESPTVVACHNRSFDLKFLSPYIPWLAGSLCTLELARQYIPEAPNHKLGTLAEFLGLPAGTAHRADGDCETTLHLLRHIMTITGRTLPDLVKLATKPKAIPVMPFGKYKGRAFHALPTDYLDWIIERAMDMPPDVLLSAELARKMK